jgi:phosphoglycerate dehydrogenase-like enzyme
MPDCPIKVAILDDFQEVALKMADWSPLRSRAELTVFRDHISDLTALAERLAPFDVVCAMRERTPLRRNLLERLRRLKLIVSTGKRNASIDLEAATDLGITVCATGYVGHGAAELTWALILSACKYIPQEYASVQHGGWQSRIGCDLKGRTLGLVGLGNLGSAIARFGHAFDMQVTAWSSNLTAEQAEQQNVRLATKEQLFRESDVVSVHLVSSERTRGIIGAHELGLMKPTALFVNTSRGPIVNEAALIDALRRKAIQGAALDVFDIEPLPSDHPFRTLDNVLATPHIGFVTEDTYRIFYTDTVEAILAFLDGDPIRRMN